MKRNIYECHAEFCKAFSHPARLEILCLLKGGERSVGAITERLGMSKANVSQHLALMRMTRIIKKRRDGATIYYSLSNKKFVKACGLMQEALVQLMEGSLNLEEEAFDALKGGLQS